MPAPSVTPTTNIAAAISGERVRPADDHQRQRAQAPHQHHHRQVAPRQRPRRHRRARRVRCRSRRPPAPGRRSARRPRSARAAMNGSSTSIGPITTSTNMLANSSVHSSHGVRTTNATPSRRSVSTCGFSCVAAPRRSRVVAGRVATSSTRPTANSDGHRDRAQRRERRADQHAGDRGAERLLQHRAHRTLDAVGGQQLFGRQDPRQVGAVGGEEERRPMPSTAAATAMCQIRSWPSRPRTATALDRGDVDRLDDDDDRALRHSVRDNAADQDEGHQADGQAGRHQRQRGGIVVEGDDLQRHHDGPHALGEDRDRYRGDQQPVFAELERCEHAPTAGHARCRLLLEVRTHAVDGGRWRPSASNEFSATAPRSSIVARPTRAFAPVYTVGRKTRGSGVGERRGAALLERLDALAEVGRERAATCWPSVSRAIAASSSVSVAALMACLVLAQRHRGPASSRSITLATSASKVVGRVDRADQARSPVPRRPETRSASSAILIARVRPIAAATNADAPPSGISPILVNANRKNAFSEANTRSQASASDTPTPAAGPCTTATTGSRQRHDRPHRAVGLDAASPSGVAGRAPAVVGADARARAEAAAAPPRRTTRTARIGRRALQRVGHAVAAPRGSAS